MSDTPRTDKYHSDDYYVGDYVPETFAKELERESNLMRAALERLACRNDFGADSWLEKTGSYSRFDEPGSVQIAREALAELSRLTRTPQ